MFSGTQFFVGCFGDVDFYNSNFFPDHCHGHRGFQGPWSLSPGWRAESARHTTASVKYSLDFPLEKK